MMSLADWRADTEAIYTIKCDTYDDVADPRTDHFYSNVRDGESDAYQFTLTLCKQLDTDTLPTIDTDVSGDAVFAVRAAEIGSIYVHEKTLHGNHRAATQ